MATVLDGLACPECQRNAAYPLEALNREALVDYFRCSACGHVWTTPKHTEKSSTPPPHGVSR